MYSNWKFNQVNDRLVSYRQCKQDIFSKLSLEKSIKFPEFLTIIFWQIYHKKTMPARYETAGAVRNVTFITACVSVFTLNLS